MAQHVENVGNPRDPAIVSSHAFRPREPAEPWGLCVTCGLAQAAHRETIAPYVPLRAQRASDG